METWIEAAGRHAFMARQIRNDVRTLEVTYQYEKRLWRSTNGQQGLDHVAIGRQVDRLDMLWTSLEWASAQLRHITNCWIPNHSGHPMLFVGVDFRNIDWEDALLRSETFQNCNFSGVTFVDARVGAFFKDCDLTNAAFINTNVNGLRLNGCNIHELSFGDNNSCAYAREEWGTRYYGVRHRNCIGIAIGMDRLVDWQSNNDDAWLTGV